MRKIYFVLGICLFGYLAIGNQALQFERDRAADELAETNQKLETALAMKVPERHCDEQGVTHWFQTRNFIEAKRRLCAKPLPTPPVQNKTADLY
jgi:hypothetical protein